MDVCLTMPRVLGIDPGLNITGYGVVSIVKGQPKLEEAGVVRSTSSRSLESRIRQIHDGLSEVIASTQPTVLALEELYSHYERPQTAILMGHARGVICLAAAQADLQVHHYAATKVKKLLTGNGRAPKDQMQTAIQREFGLSQPPEPADVADALAIALCHIFSSRLSLNISA
jgi:crossover junction endodeoxyribonuclease RuvC